MTFNAEQILIQRRKLDAAKNVVSNLQASMQQLAQAMESAKQELGKAHIDAIAEQRVLELMEADEDGEKPE